MKSFKLFLEAITANEPAPVELDDTVQHTDATQRKFKNNRSMERYVARIFRAGLRNRSDVIYVKWRPGVRTMYVRTPESSSSPPTYDQAEHFLERRLRETGIPARVTQSTETVSYYGKPTEMRVLKATIRDLPPEQITTESFNVISSTCDENLLILTTDVGLIVSERKNGVISLTIPDSINVSDRVELKSLLEHLYNSTEIQII